MELTAAHLRYLLAIYETARTQLDVSSRTIAERLGVTPDAQTDTGEEEAP